MNKIMLVTGATSGFGRAIAMKFAKNGYDVIITGRRKERLDELEKELNSIIGIRVLSLNFDVRNRSETEDAIKGLPDEWKNIDILVNNAGLAAGFGHIEEGNIDDWDRMIDTNVKGLLYVSRAVIPAMVVRNSGYIFNISSIAGKEEYEFGNVYCASKHAETEFSLVRFKGDKERAKAVYTGFEAMTADDIAEAVFYCASMPSHVCINDLVITPTQQASVVYSNRR